MIALTGPIGKKRANLASSDKLVIEFMCYNAPSLIKTALWCVKTQGESLADMDGWDVQTLEYLQAVRFLVGGLSI